MRSPCRKTLLPGLLIGGSTILSLAVGRAIAETVTDDFFAGIDPSLWVIDTNQPLYSVADTAGEIRFSRPAGGSSGFQYVSLDFRFPVQGDFDASVVFRDAQITRVNGASGNQVQLNARFGGQEFLLVRSDEQCCGNNVHVYLDPPITWVGTQSNTAIAGTLRIARSGTLVTAWFDGVVIFSGNYNTDPATLTFSLQNNGTTDATAVTFDDFALSADAILWSTDVAEEAPVAAGLVRVRAFPCPSRGPVIFEADLPRAGRAVLDIFDVRGRLVDVVFRGALAGPGKQRLTWSGSGLPPGVYSYRLRTDAGDAGGKIVVLR